MSILESLHQYLDPSSILVDPADCWVYGYDNSNRHGLPDAVVFPKNHAQVLKIVQLCNEYQVPLVPRGKGTGTPGGSVPIQGGIVLSCEHMHQVLALDIENRYIVVEAGITNQTVQNILAPHNFFWPPDPTSSAICTVGGNLAYNAAGPHAVKYGTTRDNTLGLRIVTGAGIELKTGVYTTKGVVGYDFTRLLIGSEGTLAIITEATLKLVPLLPIKQLFCVFFKDIASATHTIIHCMNQPITPSVLEFMDTEAIHMIRPYTNLALPQEAKALLLIEVEGIETTIATYAESIKKILHSSTGVLHYTHAKNNQEITALWKMRKALSPALRNLAAKRINEDIVVPISTLPKLLEKLQDLSLKYNIPIVNFGHAGNGNIHVNLLVNPDDHDQMLRAHHCLEEIFSIVLSLRGSLSGEHGIGLEKKDFIAWELGQDYLQLMQAIKNQFDPKGILNPGKLFPDTPSKS